ncbi:MAG: hypothetical protein ACTS73_00310 [Arsenophonus sp. NEOnobi-MAG3]
MPSSITIISTVKGYRLILMMLKLKCLRSMIATTTGICFNNSLLAPYLKRTKSI